VRSYIEKHVEWYLGNVKEVSVFFREWRHLSGERLRTARERRSGYERVVREMIQAAQDAGDIDESVDPKYASLYVLAAVNAVPDWYRPRGADSAQRISQAYADMTVGLLTGTRIRVETVRQRRAA
jgi:hypothetical protein